MIPINGFEIDSKDLDYRREELSFIIRFQWKTANHLREAIQILLASRLLEAGHQQKPAGGKDVLKDVNGDSRKRTNYLDDGEFRQIRLQIASNPNTPPSVLSYLARQKDEKVLERVADNPRTPDETLEMLSRSALPAIRMAVADNVNTPTRVLISLVNDNDADVRYTLSENPFLPADVLAQLADDANPYVSNSARNTLAKITHIEAKVIVHHGFCDSISLRAEHSASKI